MIETDLRIETTEDENFILALLKDLRNFNKLLKKKQFQAARAAAEQLYNPMLEYIKTLEQKDEKYEKFIKLLNKFIKEG
jgi:molecular chaperone GrpE (heat shock protein)